MKIGTRVGDALGVAGEKRVANLSIASSSFTWEIDWYGIGVFDGAVGTREGIASIGDSMVGFQRITTSKSMREVYEMMGQAYMEPYIA